MNNNNHIITPTYHKTLTELEKVIHVFNNSYIKLSIEDKNDILSLIHLFLFEKKEELRNKIEQLLGNAILLHLEGLLIIIDENNIQTLEELNQFLVAQKNNDFEEIERRSENFNLDIFEIATISERELIDFVENKKDDFEEPAVSA